MKIFRLAVAFLFVPAASLLVAQAPAAAKDAVPAASTEPLVVNVALAPYRPRLYPTTNIGDHRFDMRGATMLDLITLAYDKDDAAVLGGPSWIELDRFDLAAKIDSLKAPKPAAPAKANPGAPSPASAEANPYDTIRPVLQKVLAERFHLKFHTQDRPLPGYIVTVAKGGIKLTEAKDPTGDSTCRSDEDKATPGQFTLVCTAKTAAQILSTFGGVYPHKVVDQTGLTKTYDFKLTLALGQIQTRDQYVQVFSDALNKQLGLVVTAADVPQPAMTIDAVDRVPTANVADIEKLIPALPDLEFEVASIRLAADSDPQQIRPSGSQITFTGFALTDLLIRAFDLATGRSLGDALPNLPKQRYTVLVKLPPEIDARAVWQDQDQVNEMLTKLLVDRFGLKYHWGAQTMQGYVLLPGTPKMKKADPNSRSFCKFGPPPGEKNMAEPGSAYDREFYCQNVTMPQFADLVQGIAGVEVKSRVPDHTGLAGAYDFTLYFTTGHKMRLDATAAAAAADKQGAGETSEPVGGMSIEDAFRKELGIRMELQQVSLPVLILDHYEATPSDN